MAIRRASILDRLSRRAFRRRPAPGRVEEMSDHMLRDIGLDRPAGPADLRDRIRF